MQIIQRYLGLVLGIMFVPFGLSAEVVKESIDVSYDYYSDNVGVAVYSPVIGMAKLINEKWGVIANLRFDAITAASNHYASGKYHDQVITDAVTGASDKAFDDLRIAPDIGFVYEDGMSKTNFGFYGSIENDYMVFAARINEQLSFNDANTIVSAGAAISYEQWDPAINRKLSTDTKNVYTLTASLTQLLNPQAYLTFNAEYTLQKGFLASPYRYINTQSYAAFDKYPEQRQSFPVSLTYVQQIADDFSTNVSYRLFTDTWDMMSHTIDTKGYYDVTESITLGARLRYYYQSGVGFIKPLNDYSSIDDPDYVVSDYKYSQFSSTSAGLSFFYRPGFIEDENIVIKLSGNYYITSDNDYIESWYGEKNIKATYFTTTFTYEF